MPSDLYMISATAHLSPCQAQAYITGLAELQLLASQQSTAEVAL